MDQRTTPHGTLLGTIPGLASDGDAVRATLDELRPTTVALGVPPEDLPALQALAEADDPAALMPHDLDAPMLPGGHGAPGLEAVFGMGDDEIEKDRDDAFSGIDPVQERLLRLLQRFGDVRLPSPDLQAAYSWALENEAEVVALDMDDDTHTDVYVAANRFWDVLKNNRMQKKLLRMEFDDAQDADALVRAYDGVQMRLRSLREVEEARERHMALRFKELDGAVGVVPAARIDGIVAGL